MQKWSFDPKEETDLVKDAVALYLACMQVRTEIEQGLFFYFKKNL